MRKTLILSVLLLLPFAAFASAWDSLAVIESQIRAPQFPKRDFPITRFGASVRGNAAHNQRAIQRAIDRCSKQGGGRVVVPAGTWHTAALTLRDRVNLVVETGATLLFDFEPSLYPMVRTTWEGVDCYNHQPLIYAWGARDIAVTGGGTIDGGAGTDSWWAWTGYEGYGWREGMPTARTGRHQLMALNADSIPVGDRRCEGMGIRPQLINFGQCENVLIEGVTLLRSPFWVIHPLECNNVIVRGVRVWNEGPNGDGCDPESCSNVLIENCTFHTGDDCIALKSGRNADGRRRNRPCRNVIVRGCKMEDGHGGVVIGSEITGGANHVFVEDCDMDSPHLDRVIRIKSNTCRGGDIHDIYVRNVRVGECREAVLKINLDYDRREAAPRGFYPSVRNVVLENVTCNKSRYGIYMIGVPERLCISNINVNDCHFNGVTDRAVLMTGQVADISIK